MDDKLISSITDIINFIYGNEEKYTIQIAYYEYSNNIWIQMNCDETNFIIFNKIINGSKKKYLDISNKLRDLCVNCEALYSKLDIHNHKKVTYNRQTIYLQNLKVIININVNNYEETIAAAKYHKTINYPKQNAKHYEIIKTIQPKISIV